MRTSLLISFILVSTSTAFGCGENPAEHRAGAESSSRLAAAELSSRRAAAELKAELPEADPAGPPHSRAAPSNARLTAATRASANTHVDPLGMRRQIKAAITQAEQTVVDRESLLRYLDELEARAKTNGRVTALEIEPGLAAARRLREMDALIDFDTRMRELIAQLQAPKTEPRAAP